MNMPLKVGCPLHEEYLRGKRRPSDKDEKKEHGTEKKRHPMQCMVI